MVIKKATITKLFDATTDGGAAADNTNIDAYMNQVWVQLVRGPDKPDLIVADNNYWRFYLESLQGIQRINDDRSAQLGFQNLKYMSADVLLDGGVDGDAGTNTMYFLNTNYLFFKTARGRDFARLPSRSAVNQDAEVHIVVWAGNLCASNRRLQGVLTD